jgi:hypothetical protein
MRGVQEMILPTKHIQEKDTLLGVGATILEYLNHSKPVSRLWDEVKIEDNVGTFERYILALDMLFLFGLIILDGTELKRCQI